MFQVSLVNMYHSLSAHGNSRQLNSCGIVWNSEAPELDEKALLNILRNRNQKVTTVTGPT